MRRKFIFIVLLFLIARLACAENKFNVGVTDFSGRSVSAADAVAISDFFRSGLVNSGVFNVLERSNMELVLNEQKFQMSGCTEQDCAIKMGKILNVQKMIVGTVSVFERTYYINAQIVDVEKGVIEASDKISTPNKNELPQKAEELALKLANVKSKPQTASRPAGQKEAPQTGVTPLKISLLPKLSIPSGNVVTGVGLGLLGSRDNKVYGINGSYIYSRVEQKMIGLEGGIYNVVDGKMIGIQTGVVSLTGTLYGAQYGIFSKAGTTYGVQIGYINVASTMNGIQFGLINYTQYIKGLQIGIVNIATKSTFLPGMVLINIGF